MWSETFQDEWRPFVYSLFTGWGDLVDLIGNEWGRVYFRKISPDDVMFTGAWVGGTLTSGSVIGHLPEGYRPDAFQSLVLSALGNNMDPSIRIHPQGTVQIHGVASSVNGASSPAGAILPIHTKD